MHGVQSKEISTRRRAWGYAKKRRGRPRVELTPVHILVEVATTKVQAFWTDVEKVFMSTVFGHE